MLLVPLGGRKGFFPELKGIYWISKKWKDKYYKLKHSSDTSILVTMLKMNVVLMLKKKKRVSWYHLSKSSQLRSRRNHAVQYILDLVISWTFQGIEITTSYIWISLKNWPRNWLQFQGNPGSSEICQVLIRDGSGEKVSGQRVFEQLRTSPIPASQRGTVSVVNLW